MTNFASRMGHAFRAVGLAALAGGIVAAMPANAATQGTVGATSTGSISINASVPGRAVINSLTDVTFASVDPTIDAVSAQAPCVWSNTSTRGYKILASGSGASGAFTLTDGTVTVPYTVGWADSANATSLASLTAGTASATLAATAANPACSGGADSTLQVAIASSSLQSMVANTAYLGTLTLVVTPQ